MYTADSIAPSKAKIHKQTPFIWYAFTTISIFLADPLLTIYNDTHNQIYLILGIILPIILVIVIQEIIAGRYLKIFPYWTLILIVGLILGTICSILFIGIILFSVLYTSNYATTLSPVIGKDSSIFLTVIASLLTPGIMFAILIYIFWYRIVKPLHSSAKLKEKNKILLEGFVAVIVSVIISISMYAAVLILSFSNVTIAVLFGSLTFSYLTFSGFNEIFTENKFLHVFEIHD